MPLNSLTEGACDSEGCAPSTLFVVATPIGNLEDITLRALRILRSVDLVAAEDTRHTRKLLARYDIHTPLVSYHEYNKEKRTPELLRKLESGRCLALVTDAGTPSISDPGYYLVREAAKRQGMSIVPIPGASAVISALSVSGLPSDTFVFVGFVPRKASKAKRLFEQLKAEPRTLVFYESPRRLLQLTKSVLQELGDREAVVARELTKRYEEILRGGLSELVKEMEQRPLLMGECTLLVGPSIDENTVTQSGLRAMLEPLMKEGRQSLSDAVKIVAKASGASRKTVYAEAVKIREGLGRKY